MPRDRGKGGTHMSIKLPLLLLTVVSFGATPLLHGQYPIYQELPSTPPAFDPATETEKDDPYDAAPTTEPDVSDGFSDPSDTWDEFEDGSGCQDCAESYEEECTAQCESDPEDSYAEQNECSSHCNYN